MEILLAASLDQCGLSERQIQAVGEEGYLTITDFSLNRYSDIDSFAKKLQALPPERGGMRLGHMHVLRLKAFLYWLKNLTRRGIDLYDVNEDFGQYELEESIKSLKKSKRTRIRKQRPPISSSRILYGAGPSSTGTYLITYRV